MDDIKETLTCTICYEVLASPKILPCHHSFCLHCLDKYISDRYLGVFPCPLCTRQVKIPVNGAAGLQNDFRANTLGEIVVSYTGQPEGTLLSPPTVLPFCQNPHHEGQKLKFFCTTCEKVICRDCKMTSHEGHPTKDANPFAEDRRDKLRHTLNPLNDQLELCQKKKAAFFAEQEAIYDDKARAESILAKEKQEVCEKIRQYIVNEEKIKSTFGAEASQLRAMTKDVEFKCEEYKSMKDEVERLVAANDIDVLTKFSGVRGRAEHLGKLSLPSFKTRTFSYNPKIVVSPADCSRLLGNISRPEYRYAAQPVLVNSFWADSSKGDLLVTGLESFNDKIAVCCYYGNALRLFDCGGGMIREIGLPKAWGVSVFGQNMCVSSDGSKLVRVFNTSGDKVREITCFQNEAFSDPSLAVNDQNVVVCDGKKGKIYIVSYDDGLLVQTFPTGSVHFKHPYYVSLTKNNNIVVTENTSHTIKALDSAGNELWSIGGQGQSGGQFKYPNGTCVDPYQNIIVADYGNDRVQLLSHDGKFIRVLLHPADVKRPTCLAIDVHNNIVVGQADGMVKTFKYID